MFGSLSLGQHLAFIACVALATYIQNLTGFAFGLVLLGLVGAFQIASLPVAANVVTMMVLANAVMVVRRRPQLPGRTLELILGTSLIGVASGVWMLTWLSHNASNVLRLVLGVAIVVCSFLLVARTRKRETMSGPLAFVGYAGLSGVMGGIFASAGPPMVFHMYRQPLEAQTIKETLVLLFAVNAVLRLIMVVSQRHFDDASIALSLEALPVVLGLTWYARRYPPGWSPTVVRRVVFALLLGAGTSLVVPALTALR